MQIRFEGIVELENALKENVTLDDVKRVVHHHGAGLQDRMQSKAVFTRGYSTGATKRSIGLEMKDGGLTAEVAPETEYSPYDEFGTRFMDAQPFVKPAWDEQKEMFKQDMDKLVK